MVRLRERGYLEGVGVREPEERVHARVLACTCMCVCVQVCVCVSTYVRVYRGVRACVFVCARVQAYTLLASVSASPCESLAQIQFAAMFRA